MNFGEWSEKRKKETADAVSFGDGSFGGGGSFGGASGTRERAYGGRGGVSAPAVPDYAREMNRLQEQRRVASVNLDVDGINAADDAMKFLRAQTGRQTWGDRMGDMVGAAAANTVGSVANVLSTARRILGDEDASYDLADTAAEASRDFARSAKAGLGKIGSFAVDTGIAGLDLLGDAAINALVPGSGLAMAGVRGFGSGVQEARHSGASLSKQTAYGLGTAATNVLTEKLGNTGLFKGAYGGGWLKDPVVGTLGKLAHSAVSEAGEEFAEGLFDPVLRRFTYDEDASYDDDWFRETLYETAMGAVLGGIGGAVDVGTDRDAEIHSEAKMGKANYDDLQASLIRGEHRTFRNLVAGVDTKVSTFFDKWREGRSNNSGEKLEKLYLGRVPESVSDRVADIVGYDVDIRDVIVTNDNVKHIFNHHGDAEAEVQRGNIPLEPWMFDVLPSLVADPDFVEPGGLGRGKKNAGKRAVLFTKTFPGGTVVTVQFDNKGRRTMELTTLYARKKGTTSKPYDSNHVETSAVRPERLEPVPFNRSIRKER